MMNFIYFCLIFASGMLTAYLNWESIWSDATNFSAIQCPVRKKYWLLYMYELGESYSCFVVYDSIIRSIYVHSCLPSI